MKNCTFSPKINRPTTPNLNVKSKYLLSSDEKSTGGTPKHNFRMKTFGSDKRVDGSGVKGTSK